MRPPPRSRGRPRHAARLRDTEGTLTRAGAVTIFNGNENCRSTDAEADMRRAAGSFVLFLLPFLALAGPAEPATYHVAPNGSDTSPGTLAAPFGTLQHAADLVLPGDTVLVRAGTYHQVVTVSRSGTAGAEIVFAAYPGERPVLDGAGLLGSEWLGGIVHVLNAAHIRVRGLTLTNAGPGIQAAGILVEDSQHVTVEDNVTDDTTSSGIGVWNCEDVTLQDNEVIRACTTGIQEQISVGGTRGFRVVGNRIHDAGGTDNGGEGICLKDGSSDGVVRGNTVWNQPKKPGIYVDAWDKHTHDIEVDGNVVHDCTDGIGLASEMGGLLERVRVTNNVCYRNAYLGLVVANYGDSATHPMNDLRIVNNTFAGNGTSGWGGGLAVDSREARSVVVRNNVVSGHPSFGILVALAIPAGVVTVDHNLIDAFMGDVGEGETRGTDAVEAEPRFVDAAAHDYRLAADSPALDRGNPALAPSLDFDGVSRPQGSGIDLGAFERPAGPVTFTTTLFVPVVLRSEGRGGSYFTSELTLTNRGDGAASVRLDYTGVGGSPAGNATTSLGPRRQVVLPDAIAWLRSNGVPIPATGNAVGTLRATFGGLAAARDAAVLVRTTTPVPPAAPVGAAGLSYAGVRLEDLPSGPVFLGGLRSDASDRSNVAVQNAGAAGDGDATLRVTLVSGGASPGTTVATETVTLAPGGFFQLAVPDGFVGTARVERIAGSAPFYTYGVVNDNANSDGSFVAPVTVASLGGSERITLPVVVETAVFSTEVVVSNASDAARRVHLTLHTEELGDDGAGMTLDVPAGGQVSIPGFVAALRARGVQVPTPAVGPLLATADGDSTSGLFVGGRTGSPGGGGRYGLFCSGVPTGRAATGAVWLNGLQQTATTRTNLAVVNTGEEDGSTDVLLVEVWDGATGAKAGETTVEVGALRQVQVNALLTQVAPGTTQGYARVTRISGANPFVAYAVLNDGAVPGARSGDGAWVTSD